MRLRDKRERQALKALMARRRMTALDLGRAATKGEAATRCRDQERLGLAIGAHFVKRRIARCDRFNCFEWVPND